VIAEIDTGIGYDTTFTMPIIGNNAMYLTHNGLVKLSDHERGEFSVAEYIKVLEEEETALIPVKLDGNDSGVRYIHYKTESLTELGYDAALADGKWDILDYAAAEGYLKFNKGETLKYVEITIHDDTNYETYEPFQLIIDEPIGGATLNENQDTMIVAIRDDDYENPLGFTFTSKVVDEADGNVVLTVHRNDDAFLKACSVDYRIESDGTPEEEGYIDQHGTLDFEKGDIEKSIAVTLVNDDDYVPGRSFTVVLENPRLVDVDSEYDSVIIEINDSDNLAGVEFDQSINIEDVEDARTYTFNIERENTNGSIILLVATGTAIYGVDYTSNMDLSGFATIEFEDEELIKTVTINILDDDEAEPKESIQLKLLKGEMTDLEPGDNNEFEITIVDDDAILPSSPLANESKNGSQSVTFYHLVEGADLNIYDVNGDFVKAVSPIPRDYWTVHIDVIGDGYYGIQTVDEIESEPSNTFSLTNVPRDTMVLDSSYEGMYTFSSEELVEHYDGYDLEYIIISVNETLPDNRKIFYLQSYYTPFELEEGSVLADLGYEVVPDLENYKNEAKLMKEYNPENKIYYFITTGTELLSEILYYGEVQ
ncbi:MAG: Calx-beta domain-containing protein, partial [Sedimentibacter sp.]